MQATRATILLAIIATAVYGLNLDSIVPETIETNEVAEIEFEPTELAQPNPFAPVVKHVIKALTPEAKKLAAMAKVKLAKLAPQAAGMIKVQEVKEAHIKAAAVKQAGAIAEEEVQVAPVSPLVKQGMQISREVVKALTPEAKKLAAVAKFKLAKLTAKLPGMIKVQEVKEADIKAAAVKAAKTEEEVQVAAVAPVSPLVKQGMQISREVVKALTPEAKKLAAMAKFKLAKLTAKLPGMIKVQEVKEADIKAAAVKAAKTEEEVQVAAVAPVSPLVKQGMQITREVVKALTPEAKKLAAMAKFKLAKLTHQAAGMMKVQEVKEADIKAAALKAN